jgi:hypothetical protein
MATTGPVQILIVDVGEGEPTGEVLAELKVLGEQNVVRLIDLLVIHHHEDGQMEAVEIEGAPDGGMTVARLTGLHDGSTADGDEVPAESADHDDIWYAADAIPPGKTVAVALLEHRWAIGLSESLQKRGGSLLAEAWIHPLDLQAIGIAEG